MQAMWVSLKENANCRSKLTDVAGRPQKYSKQKSFSSGKENLEVDLQQAGIPVRKVIFRPNNSTTNENQLQQTGNPVCEVLFRPNFPRTQLYKINIGDPSRNVIETIFQRALMDPSNPSRKIKRVLKVKNSVETIERFEKYRENVKKKAYEPFKIHPRSSVDGNELLRFYGTVMTCGEMSSAQASELCKDPFCRVCRIIQCSFGMEHLKKNGIRLSTSSEELCDNFVALTKVKNVKRAVIICRTIAGRVANMVIDGAYEECDSFTSGLNSNRGDLIVKAPSAVLPCFVIVFT